jgi:opacity protein-like surface antigen
MRTAFRFATVLALALMLGIPALAQSETTTAALPTDSSSAAPAATPAFNAIPAAPKPQGGGGGGSFEARRFEFTVQFGGSAAGNMGEVDLGNCVGFTVAVAADACDPNQSLNHEGLVPGVYPGRIGGVRAFQRYGGVAPQNGGFGGVRFGINVNPNWQVEAIYNYSTNALAFTNKRMLDAAVNSFVGAGFGAERSLSFIDGQEGQPAGSQHMLLFNINRNWHTGGRVVPYVGAGVGMVHWGEGPRMVLQTITDCDCTVNPVTNEIAQMTKTVDSSTGFAWDIAAGAKVYITNSVGFRFDFMQVFSYPQITHTFQSIDVNDMHGNGAGALYPVSGTVEQSGRFSQSMFSGGIFWAFGGGLGTSGSAPAGDRDSMNDRWEFGFNFGGARGTQFGDHNPEVTCAEAVAGGCDLTLPVDVGNGNGVFENRLATNLPGFLATGGIEPGSGWMFGLDVGFNFTPNWTVKFIFNYLGTGTRFTNEDTLHDAVSDFYSGNQDEDPRDLTYENGNDGTPRGNQQQFLFNLQYNFQPNRRIVPYVGVGAGAVRWMDGPAVELHEDITSGQNQIADFAKFAGDTTGFAIDFVGGVKLYVSRHFGFRAEVMDVISWTDFDHTFVSIDTNGDFTGVAGSIVPMSGVLHQERKAFNQLQASGGVFWTF